MDNKIVHLTKSNPSVQESKRKYNLRRKPSRHSSRKTASRRTSIFKESSLVRAATGLKKTPRKQKATENALFGENPPVVSSQQLEDSKKQRKLLGQRSYWIKEFLSRKAEQKLPYKIYGDSK